MSEHLQDRTPHDTEAIRAFGRLVARGHRGDLWLDTVKSDWQEGSQTAAAGRIDALIATLGGNAIEWQKALVYTASHANHADISPVTVEISRERGSSIGAFVTDLAYWSLPIELQEEGDSAVVVTLDFNDSFDVQLTNDGSYQTLYPEDEDEDSEVYYWLDYHAHVVDKSTG